MVTSKDFTEGMNNLFKEFNKLNPFKKLWYKITSKKSEFQKRMEQTSVETLASAALELSDASKLSRRSENEDSSLQAGISSQVQENSSMQLAKLKSAALFI